MSCVAEQTVAEAVKALEQDDGPLSSRMRNSIGVTTGFRVFVIENQTDSAKAFG